MTNTPPPPPAPDSADPSMEEILASIRRILNEDEPGPAARDTTSQTPPEDDVLVLDDSMLVLTPDPTTPPPAAAPPAAEPLTQEMEVRTPTLPADPPDPSEQKDLVAPETAAAAAISVSGLMRALAAGRATQVYSGGPTLEDLVRSELRLLLKEWLDANLPPLVERLVRAEIERVVGRAVL
jgi:cell pole-organizing protein PopZ